MAIERVQPAPGQESVWDYPRPPRVEPCRRRVRVEFAGVTIADSAHALRVLETSHPPSIYIPEFDIAVEYLRAATGSSFCEWKGRAAYYDLVVGHRISRQAAWWYPSPDHRYRELTAHISFYPAGVDRCSLDDELVRPQEGGFYGGWVTNAIAGPFKGGRGTEGW